MALLKTLIVIVPAYNEEGRIGETVARLRIAASLLSANDLAVKIYVVNDGSVDATAQRARDVGVDRIINHNANRGLGAAVRSGLNAARQDGADIVVKFDADLQHEPSDLQALIEPILQDEADLVYGCRLERISYRMPL